MPKVIIMGGSLGGLTAALFLREAGCAVTVSERSTTPLVGLGAGIVLNPATVRYFTRSKILDVAALSTTAHWLRYLDPRGQVVAEQHCAYRFTSYNAIYRELLAAFGTDNYLLGEAVTAFEQAPESVSVQLSSGRMENCDLLVCADGIRSTARARLLPHTAMNYAGYVAWRGIVEENMVPREIFAALSNSITYYLLPNSHILIYPIPIVDSGSDRVRLVFNWLWYRNIPAGPGLANLMTDREGVLREVSLGAGAVQETNIAALHQDATSLLPPPLAEMVLATTQPFLQAVMDCEVDRMAFGRICLIGDAAFVARPHAAAGTAKAAEDGWQLAQAIQASAGEVVSALQRWEPAQLALGRTILDRTREAGRRAQVDNTWQIGDPLPFGLYSIGDSSMP